MVNIEKVLKDLNEVLDISEEVLLESPQNKQYVEFGICSQSKAIIDHIRKLQLWGYESSAVQTIYDIYVNLKTNYMTGKKTTKTASKHLEEWLRDQYAENYQEYIEGANNFAKLNKTKYETEPKELNEKDFENCRKIYDLIIAYLKEENLKDREDFYVEIKNILGFTEQV